MNRNAGGVSNINPRSTMVASRNLMALTSSFLRPHLTRCRPICRPAVLDHRSIKPQINCGNNEYPGRMRLLLEADEETSYRVARHRPVKPTTGDCVSVFRDQA
jgi:hypothetical protein